MLPSALIILDVMLDALPRYLSATLINLSTLGVVISNAVIRKKLLQNGEQNFLVRAVNYENT